MKKAIIFFALLLGFGASAQRGPQKHDVKREQHAELSSEQRATLQSKRMTLALGLMMSSKTRWQPCLKHAWTKGWP